MPLLPSKVFAPVSVRLRGKRIGYILSYGNVGDQLIEWATFQLFEAFADTLENALPGKYREVSPHTPGGLSELQARESDAPKDATHGKLSHCR
jgi:hypothetical protein